MAGVTRVSDVFFGICPNHRNPVITTGVIITGSVDVLADSMSVAYQSSIGFSTCGHTTLILTGSATVLVNQKGMARQGSVVATTIRGNVITGSPDVITNS